MALTSLEKMGCVFTVGLFLFLVKIIFSTIYIYALGPALNKVDFKSKGKWAREYNFFTIYVGFNLFLYCLKFLVIKSKFFLKIYCILHLLCSITWPKYQEPYRMRTRYAFKILQFGEDRAQKPKLIENVLLVQ